MNGQGENRVVTDVSNVVFLIPAYKPGQGLLSIVDDLYQDSSAKIVVVNDGSGAEFEALFAELGNKQYVDLVVHEKNRGKGAALKTGMSYVLSSYPQADGVVTLDADGQHKVQDVMAVAAEHIHCPSQLVLGSRAFDTDVPLRSDLGNKLTALLFSTFSGVKLQDTQTGLRAIPRSLMSPMLELKPNGYDFEMDALMLASSSKVKIKEVPIKTVYEDNNASSHFNPVLDSFKIYFILLRFIFSSLLAAGIDFLLFFVFHSLTGNKFGSLVVGRIFSGAFNFAVNRSFTFKSESSHWAKQAGLYFLTAVLVVLSSYSLIVLFVDVLGWNVYASKLIAETSIFVLSFIFQKNVVFKRKTH